MKSLSADAPYDARNYLGSAWLGDPIDPIVDPWHRFGRLMRELDDSLRIEPGARWLDLGCHQGQFLKIMQGRYGIVPHGADDWDPALNTDPSWSYVQRDLNRAVDAGGDYAFVSALEVLEHMIDTDKFLDACREHLAPNGHLLLSTPNINSLRNRITVPLGAYPTGLEYRTVIHHVRLYNVHTLRSHLEEQGFSVLWIKGVNFLPVSALQRGASLPLDRRLANALPHLCGNVMALARRRD